MAANANTTGQTLTRIRQQGLLRMQQPDRRSGRNRQPATSRWPVPPPGDPDRRRERDSPVRVLSPGRTARSTGRTRWNRLPTRRTRTPRRRSRIGPDGRRLWLRVERPIQIAEQSSGSSAQWRSAAGQFGAKNDNSPVRVGSSGYDGSVRSRTPTRPTPRRATPTAPSRPPIRISRLQAASAVVAAGSAFRCWDSRPRTGAMPIRWSMRWRRWWRCSR